MSLSLYDPWLWIGVGAAMMLGEMLISGYLLLGFGIAAVAMGALVWAAPETLGALPYAPLSLVLIYALAAFAVWGVVARRFGRGARGAKGARDINDFEHRG